MIDYSETWLILTLLRWKGSVFPRSCTFAVPAAVLTWILLEARGHTRLRWMTLCTLIDDFR